MWWMHQILELPEVPRDREKLKAILGEARYRRRISLLITLVLTFAIAGVMIALYYYAYLQPAMDKSSLSHQISAAATMLHLPLIAR